LAEVYAWHGFNVTHLVTHCQASFGLWL
jgi:hypothetical protein